VTKPRVFFTPSHAHTSVWQSFDGAPLDSLRGKGRRAGAGWENVADGTRDTEDADRASTSCAVLSGNTAMGALFRAHE